MSRSEFLMWGERGLMATFFADLHLASSLDAIGDFLRMVEIGSPRFPRQADSVIWLIEPDFGNRGFGHPDAILRIESGAQSFVLIIEAKRTPYVKATMPAAQRDVPGFNSSINGQVELNYVLAICLPSFKPVDTELIEPDWISRTPYSSERKGLRRHLRNQVVLRKVVDRFAGLPSEHYFHIVLTTDESNPFSDAAARPLLPQLYRAHSPHTDAWDELSCQFGWFNYTGMKRLVIALRDTGGLGGTSLFLDSYELNGPNMSGGQLSHGRPERHSWLREHENAAPVAPRAKGVSVIYAPALSANTFLHFSWLGESCALRDYSASAVTQPNPVRQYTTSYVRSVIRREDVVHGPAITDTAYWHTAIRQLNAKFIDK